MVIKPKVAISVACLESNRKVNEVSTRSERQIMSWSLRDRERPDYIGAYRNLNCISSVEGAIAGL